MKEDFIGDENTAARRFKGLVATKKTMGNRTMSSSVRGLPAENHDQRVVRDNGPKGKKKEMGKVKMIQSANFAKREVEDKGTTVLTI